MLECIVKIFGNLQGFFCLFTMYWKGRWTFRNCSSSHRVLMPESALSRLWIFPTAAGTPQKMWSVWSGVTHIMSGLKAEVAEDAQWWEQTATGWHLGGLGSLWWILYWRGHQKHKQEVGHGSSRGCCGRKYLGRCCPTPVTAPQTSLLREPLPHGSSSIIVIHTFGYFFHKIFFLQR